jgi:hypothetical protein
MLKVRKQKKESAGIKNLNLAQNSVRGTPNTSYISYVNNNNQAQRVDPKSHRDYTNPYHGNSSVLIESNLNQERERESKSRDLAGQKLGNSRFSNGNNNSALINGSDFDQKTLNKNGRNVEANSDLKKKLNLQNFSNINGKNININSARVDSRKKPEELVENRPFQKKRFSNNKLTENIREKFIGPEPPYQNQLTQNPRKDFSKIFDKRRTVASGNFQQSDQALGLNAPNSNQKDFSKNLPSEYISKVSFEHRHQSNPTNIFEANLPAKQDAPPFTYNVSNFSNNDMGVNA